LCRKLAAEISKIKPKLDELGVTLIAVGSGTPFMAKAFVESQNFKGDFYVDQKLNIYKALNCKRGIGATLGLKALGSVKTAIAEGYRQGATQGDGLQQGGVFIMSLTEGILWQHLEEFAGNHPDLEKVVAEARSAVEMDKPKN